MPRYEYKVVPAPNRGIKGKGVKGAEARFSHAIQELMNGLAGDGWEYQRAETLPSVERSGLTSTTTEWRHVLVFRRLREADAENFTPELLPAPAETQPEPEPISVPMTEPVEARTGTEEVGARTGTEEVDAPTASLSPEQAEPSAAEPWDNGVEDTSTMEDDSALRRFVEARKSTKTKR